MSVRELANKQRARKGLGDITTGQRGKDLAHRPNTNMQNLKDTSSRLSENDRLINAWCAQEGAVRSDCNVSELHSIIDQAIELGL